ncbi:MAG: RidA family protein, partial [Phreatobacter sp.]
MTPEDKLAKMGLELPPVPTPAGNYVPWKRVGDIAYLAGQGPRKADGAFATGKVGADVTVETAYEH